MPKYRLLKYFLYVILYLNTYTLFFESLQAQNIRLELNFEKKAATAFTDSLLPTPTFPDYKSLNAQIANIQTDLTRLGYLDRELTEIIRANDSVVKASFTLGNQWKELKIYYNEVHFSENQISTLFPAATKTFFTIPLPQAEKALKALNKLQTSNGTPFSSLQLSQIQKLDTKTVTANLQTLQGNRRFIDNIIIKGYEKFPPSFLPYYAGITKGQPFNQKKLRNQNDLLNNLGFTKTTKPPQALFRKDSTDIYFYLEKTNNNLFDGIIGFATNETTQKLEFNGYLNLDLNNNLNFGEQLLVNYKSDGREQINFQVKTTLPYVFRSPVTASLELKIFKRDSTFSTTDQQARLIYQTSPESSLSIGYKTYESINLLDEVLVGDPVQDYTSNYITGGIDYIKRQTQNFFPTRTRLSIVTEIGNRQLTNIKERQYRIIGDFSHSFNLNSRNSIFVRNTTSFLSSSNYLVNELFRFGGVNSVRGFSENSIDASLFSVLNTEYRYVFNQSTYLHSIIDLGYFENEITNINEELYSFGLGLGLQTEAGIFKLNIANGISGTQNFKFSNTKIHLSLSSRF